MDIHTSNNIFANDGRDSIDMTDVNSAPIDSLPAKFVEYIKVVDSVMDTEFKLSKRGRTIHIDLLLLQTVKTNAVFSDEGFIVLFLESDGQSTKFINFAEAMDKLKELIHLHNEVRTAIQNLF